MVLAANNARKLPLSVGFDVQNHLDYIFYLVNRHRIPVATDGWQMFQSPLYYVISAGWWSLSCCFCSGVWNLMTLLRFIPLACGIIQVELAYRAVVVVFPGRSAAQIAGILVGGLLPMNLYISQAVGNEPMAGMLSAAAIVYTMHLLQNGGPLHTRQTACLGLLIGLAVLTKVTAVLLIPLMVLAVLHLCTDGSGRVRTMTAQSAWLLGSIVIVAGWYFLRNWLLLGTPFLGGWDSSRGFQWWQDPGYRLPGDFFRFGAALKHPVYAATSGFWDSFYSTFWCDGLMSGVITASERPPWNYTPMLACALWSLLPTLAIFVGCRKAILRDAPIGLTFSVVAVALYLAAMLGLYLMVPIYSTAKASYTTGATPCYAVLCTAGFAVLCRKRWSTVFAMAGILCWAVSAYAGYFIV